MSLHPIARSEIPKETAKLGHELLGKNSIYRLIAAMKNTQIFAPSTLRISLSSWSDCYRQHQLKRVSENS